MFYDTRKIEFVDDKDKPCPTGGMGKILVTDLENRLFPLIRYEIGDKGRALPGTCSCGVTLPLMDKVMGRISDLIKLPTGQVIDGAYMTDIFEDEPDAVRQFQVQQSSDYSIKILVVPNPEFPDVNAVLNKVAETLRATSDNQVPVEVELTNHIPHAAGKLRFIKSSVG